MFERFTERARHAVAQAQEQARLHRHHYIGTEHLLLGLIAGDDSAAARVLDELGVTLEQVTEKVLALVGAGTERVDGQVPFTPRAKAVLERSLREALKLGHRHVGTEHLLLGLIAGDDDCVAVRVLGELELPAEQIRDAVSVLLTAPEQARSGSPAGRRAQLTPLVELLTEHGYQAHLTDTAIVLELGDSTMRVTERAAGQRYSSDPDGRRAHRALNLLMVAYEQAAPLLADSAELRALDGVLELLARQVVAEHGPPPQP